MAKDKNSFIAYLDWGATFDELDDVEAGQLIKHLFNYVRDKNPESPSKLITIAFEHIKQDLKRDLKKWVGYIEKQSVNGAKGGRPKEPKETQITQPFIEEPKKADNVFVFVNDNVNDNVTVKNNTFRPDEKFELDLPEIKINAAVEYISRTKYVNADKPLVLSLWSVFKQKNFTGEKLYKSNSDIFRHFFESLKYEQINGNTRQLQENRVVGRDPVDDKL